LFILDINNLFHCYEEKYNFFEHDATEGEWGHRESNNDLIQAVDAGGITKEINDLRDLLSNNSRAFEGKLLNY